MLFYAIMSTIVLALMGLVGAWIKGPNWKVIQGVVLKA